MKSKIIFSLLTFFILVACKKNVDTAGNTNGTQIISQSNVPDAVLASFNASFSSSTEREWLHNEDNFTCQFNINGQRHEAGFDDNGHENGHSVICIDAPVPAVVLNAFRSSYPNEVVYEWKFTNEGTWKAHFLRGTVKHEVTIDASGRIIKEEHD